MADYMLSTRRNGLKKLFI